MRILDSVLSGKIKIKNLFKRLKNYLVIKQNKFLFIEKKGFLNPRCIYIIATLYLIKKNTKRDRIDFKRKTIEGQNGKFILSCK